MHCRFHIYDYQTEGVLLTCLIGGKSTGALSAGHISSNQQDNASRLRLLLIQSCRRITVLVSHYINIKSVRLTEFDPSFSLFLVVAVCHFALFTWIVSYMSKFLVFL